MKKTGKLQMSIFLAVFLALLCLPMGCQSESNVPKKQESGQEELTQILSYLKQPKDQLWETLGLSEEDLESQIPLLYQVKKSFPFDGKEYNPWLEFADDTKNAQLFQYGFAFTELSPEETLEAAQKLVENLSAELDLENVPATNTFMNSDQTISSNTNGISGTTYEELEKWDTYELMEIWNKDDSMYFKASMTSIPLQDGNNTILIKIAYLPEGYPAFSGEAL